MATFADIKNDAKYHVERTNCTSSNYTYADLYGRARKCIGVRYASQHRERHIRSSLSFLSA